jgi:hypothetical protein
VIGLGFGGVYVAASTHWAVTAWSAAASSVGIVEEESMEIGAPLRRRTVIPLLQPVSAIEAVSSSPQGHIRGYARERFRLARLRARYSVGSWADHESQV